MRRHTSRGLAGVCVLVLLLIGGCRDREPALWQGYVEAEYVYVSAPVAGELEHLAVQRGQRVRAGDPVFALEQEPERSRVAEAEQHLAAARHRLQDLQKGLRPSEIRALTARLREAEAAADLAGAELARREQLYRTGTIDAETRDRARTDHEQQCHEVARLRADLHTAGLGGRADRVRAARAEVAQARARLDEARWLLGEKQQRAGVDAVVFDTFYREGERVPAGRAVAALLPPENRTVRFFVDQATAGRLQPGMDVQVSWDGCAQPVAAAITFISPQVEYTPPVIYSRSARADLVFMVEAVGQGGDAALLHPGQPVDVRLVSGEPRGGI